MPDDSRLADNRPSPDALLDHAERETRGRLRIFLGAAPGVGKTYEMLMSGRARMADGLDVVIGVVETHGRKETEALVEGFEVIPRRRVDYKGRQLEEMDLDAILARRPDAGPRRRTRPHQRAGQPASQALSRRPGNPGAGHRRLFDAQHPACRKPERRRGADHPRQGSRDGSRFDHRPGRRHRDHRHHARRPDQAPGRGQGLCSGDGQAGGRELLLPRQSDRASGTGAAPHRAARRRAASHPHAGPRHSGAVGGGRARPRLHRRTSARSLACPLCEAPGRKAARALGRALCRNLPRGRPVGSRSRPACGDAAPGGAIGRRGRHASGPERRRGHRPLRGGQQCHAHHHRQAAPAAVAGLFRGLRRSRPDPRGGQDQRPCRLRRGTRRGTAIAWHRPRPGRTLRHHGLTCSRPSSSPSHWASACFSPGCSTSET